MGDSQIFLLRSAGLSVFISRLVLSPSLQFSGLGWDSLQKGLCWSLASGDTVKDRGGRDVTAASPRTAHPYSRRGQAVAVTLGRGTRSSHGNLIFSQCR